MQKKKGFRNISGYLSKCIPGSLYSTVSCLRMPCLMSVSVISCLPEELAAKRHKRHRRAQKILPLFLCLFAANPSGQIH